MIINQVCAICTSRPGDFWRDRFLTTVESSSAVMSVFKSFKLEEVSLGSCREAVNSSYLFCLKKVVFFAVKQLYKF